MKKHTTIKYNTILGAQTVTIEVPEVVIKLERNQQKPFEHKQEKTSAQKTNAPYVTKKHQLRILNNTKKRCVVIETKETPTSKKQTTLEALPKDFGKDAKTHNQHFKQHMKRVYSKSRTLFIKKATATKQLLQTLSTNNYQK